MSNVRARDLGSFVAEVRGKIDRDVVLSPGYFIEYGGQFENQERATRRLMLIVPIAIMLVFVLLYLTFDSVKQVLLVVGNIPFALVGGIAALWIRGMNLNLSASIGFIALFGVAMLNGVVLVSSINQMCAAGLSSQEAVFAGARRRLRPVLMTASVASFGFIPMAISTSTGAEVQSPEGLSSHLTPQRAHRVAERARVPSESVTTAADSFRCCSITPKRQAPAARQQAVNQRRVPHRRV